MLSRLFLIRVHALLAAFFLPFGILFFVTGAFYTMEMTGSYRTETRDLPLAVPLTPDLDQLAAVAAARLAEEGIAPPTGGMRVRKVGTSFAFEWSGANRDVVLAPTADPAVAKMEIKDTTWYRRLVQLHKAKGGPVFKALAVATASALLLLFLSGTLLAWRHRALRPLSTAAFLAGLLAFAGALYLS